MDAFLLLVACVVVLMVLVSRLYRQNPRPEIDSGAEDARVDRLATLLDPDVMVSLSAEALRRGCSEIKLVNDLVRSELADPDPPEPRP